MSKNFKKTEEKKQKINFENTTKKLKKRKIPYEPKSKKNKKKTKLNFPIFSFLRRSHRSISSKTFTFGNRFENFKGAN